MKAVLSREPGGPETLELAEAPEPAPGPGTVLVEVKACGINFPDVLMIQDKYQHKPPRPFAPGTEVAGVVVALGEGVTRTRVGDRVLGTTAAGGMAERTLLIEERMVQVPDVMPWDEAAAFLTTYGTSHYALKRRAQLKAGETLLVLGAAGGVGLAAVELGKAMGARVIAACSSAEKVAICKAAGADDGVVYPRGPFDRDGQKRLAELFKTACGPKGADVIYDPIGDAYAEPAFRAIAWEGRYLVIGFAAGEIPRLPLNLTLLKGADIRGVFWGAWTYADPAGFRQDIEELLELYTHGRIRPRVTARFPLERGAEAIAHLAERKALGKVVVTLD